MLGLRAEFDRYKLLGPGAQTAADIVAGNHEVLAGLIDASDQKVDMRIVGVPVIDGDPIEPCAKIGFHLPGEVAGEGSEVGHLGGVFGRHDEPEMMPVILRSIGEGSIVGAVALGVEHARLFAVARDALALQIGEMRRHRRRAEGSALMARDPRLHHHAAAGREEPVATEGKTAAAEGRSPEAGAFAVAGVSRLMARLLCGA